MTSDIEQIVSQLEMEFPEGPPTEAMVRNQGFSYLPRHWTERWPGDLQRPPALVTGERQYVRREDIFVKARSAGTPASIVDLYLAVCAWGTGTKAQRVARCVRPLHEPGAVAALVRSFEAAQNVGSIEGCRRLNTFGEDRIKFFGPAFFTKWLYFSAYEVSQAQKGASPLILDARVARAIGWKTTGWTSGAYAEYLNLAEELRARWCPGQTVHTVEYALFQTGGL